MLIQDSRFIEKDVGPKEKANGIVIEKPTIGNVSESRLSCYQKNLE